MYLLVTDSFISVKREWRDTSVLSIAQTRTGVNETLEQAELLNRGRITSILRPYSHRTLHTVPHERDH